MFNSYSVLVVVLTLMYMWSCTREQIFRSIISVSNSGRVQSEDSAANIVLEGIFTCFLVCIDVLVFSLVDHSI